MSESIEVRFANIIGLMFSPAKLSRDASFVADLGFDSIDAIELVIAVEDEFAIEIPYDDAEKLTTVGAAIDYVTKRAAAAIGDQP